MTADQQLKEILSWRLMSELWRRFPRQFDLIEVHPGGGLYDCLMLRTKGQNPRCTINVNRVGSVHIHMLDGDSTVESDWEERMLQSSPESFLDYIANKARLVIPKKLPASTPATLTYRYISDFLTHSVGRLERWQCRNGFEDTSGYGGGVRRNFFDRFTQLQEEDFRTHGAPIFGEYAYNFWFLLRNEIPVLCLNTSGMVFCLDGSRHDLMNLYRLDRRIWPLISKTAMDLLP